MCPPPTTATKKERKNLLQPDPTPIQRTAAQHGQNIEDQIHTYLDHFRRTFMQHYFRYATLFQPNKMLHTKDKFRPQFLSAQKNVHPKLFFSP